MGQYFQTVVGLMKSFERGQIHDINFTINPMMSPTDQISTTISFAISTTVIISSQITFFSARIPWLSVRGADLIAELIADLNAICAICRSYIGHIS